MCLYSEGCDPLILIYIVKCNWRCLESTLWVIDSVIQI